MGQQRPNLERIDIGALRQKAGLDLAAPVKPDLPDDRIGDPREDLIENLNGIASGFAHSRASLASFIAALRKKYAR
jgi:hypothetical protein